MFKLPARGCAGLCGAREPPRVFKFGGRWCVRPRRASSSSPAPGYRCGSPGGTWGGASPPSPRSSSLCSSQLFAVSPPAGACPHTTQSSQLELGTCEVMLVTSSAVIGANYHHNAANNEGRALAPVTSAFTEAVHASEDYREVVIRVGGMVNGGASARDADRKSTIHVDFLLRAILLMVNSGLSCDL